MRILFTFICVMICAVSFSQWTRIDRLPHNGVFSIYHKDGKIYVGGVNKIYIGTQNGTVWDSTATFGADTLFTDNIIVFRNELFASQYNGAGNGGGVYKSSDNGRTWVGVNTNLPPFVSSFFEWNNDLYASTLGLGVFKFNTTTGTGWAPFSNNIPDYNSNSYTISGNSQVLIAGGGPNGQVERLLPNSTVWHEVDILGVFHTNLWPYRIINAHDTLFMVTFFNQNYRSTDNGLTWQAMGNSIGLDAGDMANANEAVIFSRQVFNGLDFDSHFYYKYKNSPLQDSWVVFNDSLHFYSYKIDIAGSKLWNASSAGLYYWPLSALPGISSADNNVVTAVGDPGNNNFRIGNVYPNPVIKEARINIELDRPAHVGASLYNAAGALVSVVIPSQQMTNGSHILTIRTANLESGVYFLHIICNNTIYERKIIHIN